MNSNIKIFEIKGPSFGKTVAILAGVHGNEICGVRAFDAILPVLKIDCGRVIFICANMGAIKQNKRFIDCNLNRCFLKNQPAEMAQTLEGKTAREIMPYLEQADLMLDIHASFTKDSAPFIICSENNVKIAKIFDSDLVVTNFDSFEPGSTDYFMNLQKKPGFCFECGFLGNEKTQIIAESAIKKFLTYAGCIKSKLELKERAIKHYKLASLYKNKAAKFKTSRYFPDFERFNEKTLVGAEGDKNIYCEKGDIILFARDRESLNEECFLIAREVFDGNFS